MLGEDGLHGGRNRRPAGGTDAGGLSRWSRAPFVDDGEPELDSPIQVQVQNLL
jgi:hypothetical protein